jgi:hypothetical protein
MSHVDEISNDQLTNHYSRDMQFEPDSVRIISEHRHPQRISHQAHGTRRRMTTGQICFF